MHLEGVDTATADRLLAASRERRLRITFDEAARRLGVTRREIRAFVRDGIDGTYLPVLDRETIHATDLERFARSAGIAIRYTVA